MLLLIDAGNTRIKWALLPAGAPGNAPALGAWIASGSVAHADVGHLADAWRKLKIERVLLSNVAGAAMREQLEQIVRLACGMEPAALEWFASVAELAGVRNGYRNPAQLGCDRFASVIGAHALYPGQPLIVATCGTATTVDAVTADGVFIGGMILPGLGLMAASLARNTAQLPQVAETLVVSEPFAIHTDAAIVSGCLAAQAGAIERAVTAHTWRQQSAARPEQDNVQCIMSGGAADLVASHLSVPWKKVDNLVLIGLQRVAADTQLSC
jgi:type III pantothenate kinase